MKKFLWINACLHQEYSRTLRLAKAWINQYILPEEYEIFSRNLEKEHILGLDSETLKNRQRLREKEEYAAHEFDLAKEFAAADCILIAAPYWDLSFPAILKSYIERISVCDVTFCYDETGRPKGLCQAKNLVYVTTSGGPIGNYNMGYDYIRALCGLYFGITDTECIAAEGLDMIGNDPEQILQKKIEALSIKKH